MRQTELALERARYEADRAWRQYDAVDPVNRQVAGELEARWNARLVELQDLEAALERARDAARATRLSAEERDACLELGADLAVAWNHENGTPEIRKTILRAAIEEIFVSELRYQDLRKPERRARRCRRQLCSPVGGPSGDW